LKGIHPRTFPARFGLIWFSEIEEICEHTTKSSQHNKFKEKKNALTLDEKQTFYMYIQCTTLFQNPGRNICGMFGDLSWSGSEEVDCLIEWCLKPVLAVYSYIVAVKKLKI
jgi:hypothetical protein